MKEVNAILEAKIKNKKKYQKPINEKKNSHLHIVLETSFDNKLTKEAKENGITKAELVRQKLRDSSQLNRIEIKLDKILFQNRNN
jgi:hypothetical protein